MPLTLWCGVWRPSLLSITVFIVTLLISVSFRQDLTRGGIGNFAQEEYWKHWMGYSVLAQESSVDSLSEVSGPLTTRSFTGSFFSFLCLALGSRYPQHKQPCQESHSRCRSSSTQVCATHLLSGPKYMLPNYVAVNQPSIERLWHSPFPSDAFTWWNLGVGAQTYYSIFYLVTIRVCVHAYFTLLFFVYDCVCVCVCVHMDTHICVSVRSFSTLFLWDKPSHWIWN